MIIPITGMDPSLSNWGLAYGQLDLDSGSFDLTELHTIQPDVKKNKQVRQNSIDLQRAELLAEPVFSMGERSKIIFAEVPVGSQSARAMASYGVCVGILGSLRAKGIQIIEVTAFEVKEAMTGNRTASKEEMIKAAYDCYQDAPWPKRSGNLIASKAEHMADAIGAIHAGVRTPVFKNLLQLYR